MTTATLLERYRIALENNGFSADPSQARLVETLATLQSELIAAPPPPAWLRRLRLIAGLSTYPQPVRGLYLWGSVGRGKTWLMDLFFDSLPFTEKRRSHFHRFMQGVHQGLSRHRRRRDPLRIVAAGFAAETRVICLDELFVSDIADAMLLGGLFTHLAEQGVTLVFTSNVPPSSLYRDGLQRQRFLPAIALLEQHCAIVTLDGQTDYRLRQLTQRPVYHASNSPQTAKQLTEIFETLSRETAPDRIAHRDTLEVSGRSIPVVRCSAELVWFNFADVCEGPRSAEDYVQIAREFATVIIANVPIFTTLNEDAARRFIALVDEFYDRRVNLIVSAAASPTALYRGERLRFEFERTASRLIEMQSEAYLASEHQP